MCLIRDAELLAVVAARAEPTMRNWLGELPQVHPITLALSGTPPRTRQPASASAPINWGLMDKDALWDYYLVAWINEPMMKPRKVV